MRMLILHDLFLFADTDAACCGCDINPGAGASLEAERQVIVNG